MLDSYRQKFENFRKNIGLMDELFESCFSTLLHTPGMSKPFSKCGKCRRYMKIIHKQPARLFCEICDETYSLPVKGSIKLFSENICPLDEFELVLWRGGTGESGKTIIVCPYCYNHASVPQIEDANAGMTCSICTVPTCQFSVARLAVAPCWNDCHGTLVLDVVSAPKWKLSCSLCALAILLPEGAKKISVTETICEDCGSMQLLVDFNKNRLPAPLVNSGRGTIHQGCFMCDQIIANECSESKTKITYGKRGKGRGRGRGRGGGGGGRGGAAARAEPKKR